MSSYTPQPYKNDSEQQEQQPYQYTTQHPTQQSVSQTAVMPHPQLSSADYQNASQHLAPYDPYAQRQHQHQHQHQHMAAPHPSRRHSSQSQQSHRSHHSHRSRGSHHSAKTNEERELEKRPSLGDTVILIWDSISGAFSRRR